MAQSSSSFFTASEPSCILPVFMDTSMSGLTRRRSASMAGSHWRETLEYAPRRKTVKLRWMSLSTLCSSSSAQRASAFSCGSSSRPAGDGRTPPLLRTRMRMPSSSSSEFIMCVSPDWVYPISAAAAVRLPLSSAVSSALIFLVSIFVKYFAFL